MKELAIYVILVNDHELPFGKRLIYHDIKESLGNDKI